MARLGARWELSRGRIAARPINVSLHRSNREARMSALGQKQTSRHLQPMSALPPKADIGTQPRDVRYVPKADICSAANLESTPSLRQRGREETDFTDS